MTAATITASEVRDRLRTLTSFEASDAMLAGASYILVADAWMSEVLDKNGITFSSLSDAKKALIKAAQISFAAKRVVLSAPERSVETAGVKIKGISSQDKERIAKMIDEEINDLLEILGYSSVTWSVDGNKIHVAGSNADTRIYDKVTWNR